MQGRDHLFSRSEDLAKQLERRRTTIKRHRCIDVCCILPLNVRHCAYSTLVKRRVVNMFRRNQISGKGRKFPVQKVGLFRSVNYCKLNLTFFSEAGLTTQIPTPPSWSRLPRPNLFSCGSATAELTNLCRPSESRRS